MPTTITGANGKVTSVVSILVALLLAFIAIKVLMGLVRVGVIILILVVLAGMWQSGAFA
jgi:hypothetical protein